MPKRYVVTVEGRPHPYCCRDDEPIPEVHGSTARWRLVAETPDVSEAVWLFDASGGSCRAEGQRPRGPESR